MAMNSYLINALANKNNEAKPIDKGLTLLKCTYPISIYTELKKAYSSDDYYSGFRYFIGNQPLEELPQDEATLTSAVFTFTQEMDDTSSFTITQPHINKLKSGISDLSDFAINFIKAHNAMRCKEGFTDLILANFAKIHNPTKFSDLKAIFNNDNDPCNAYEDNSLCSSLPMDSQDFVENLEKLAWKIKDATPLNSNNVVEKVVGLTLDTFDIHNPNV
jgi:hypothetical protein